jgi:ABC-type antimicrobial peptide transport system permease subunit
MGVGPQFFETMGIPVVRGRTFTRAEFSPDLRDWRDRPPEPSTNEERRSALLRSGPFIVNEAFVKRYAPNIDLVGSSSVIVGIVKDTKLFSVRDDVKPLMFVPSRRPDFITAIQVRTTGAAGVEQAIRRAIQEVNPRLFVGITTLGESSGRSIAGERMVATISGFFSVLGLALAAMGIFGIASSAVAQRTRELGIRRAIGAGRWVLVRDALRETLVVVGLGLTAGAVAAFIAVRVTSSLVAGLLFGLTPTDTANLVLSVLVMVVIAAAACGLPALRATRIDPLICIREG